MALMEVSLGMVNQVVWELYQPQRLCASQSNQFSIPKLLNYTEFMLIWHSQVYPNNPFSQRRRANTGSQESSTSFCVVSWVTIYHKRRRHIIWFFQAKWYKECKIMARLLAMTHLPNTVMQIWTVIRATYPFSSFPTIHVLIWVHSNTCKDFWACARVQGSRSQVPLTSGLKVWV